MYSLAEAVKRFKASAPQIELQQQTWFNLAKEVMGGIATSWVLPPMDPTGWIRVSSLGDLCPRRETLKAIHGITITQRIPGKQRWAMDVGTLIHSLYRDWYLGPMGLYRGAWLCIRCGKTTDDSEDSWLPGGSLPSAEKPKLAPMPEACPNCGAGRFLVDAYGSDQERTIVFHEWTLANHELGIRGHSDGWRLDPDIEDDRVSELKSASPKSFKWRQTRGPDPGHVVQAQTYMWLSGTEHGEVVYLNKAVWSNDPEDFILSFPLRLDEALLAEKVWGPVGSLRQALKNGTLTKRTCKVKDDPRAKRCDVCQLCFQEADSDG